MEVATPHHLQGIPDSKVHGANMGPIWDRQDPGEPHVGPMNLAIWDVSALIIIIKFNTLYIYILCMHYLMVVNHPYDEKAASDPVE